MDMVQTKEKPAWRDRLNPIALKELRQCNNNNTILFGCVAAVMILIYGAATILGGESRNRGPFSEDIHGWGVMLFYGATALWAFGSVFLAGVLGMFRYAQERSNAELDVGNFTDIAPHRMVRGRLFAALSLVGYLYSICLPAFVLSFMLRALPLENMVMTHIFVFAFMVCAIQCMLFVGSLGKSALCTGLCLLCIFVGPAPAFGLCSGIADQKFSAPWMILSLVYAVLLFGVFYMMNVVKTSAVHSNRLFGMKCYLLVCLLVNILLGCHYSNSYQDTETAVCFWICICSYQLLALLLALVGHSCPTTVGVRMREKCPDALLPRFCYYLLSGVWGGGYLLGFGAMLVGYGLLAWKCPEIAAHKGYIILLNTVGYILFYLVLAEIIHKIFPEKPAEALSKYVVVALNVVPILIFSFLTILQSGTDIGISDTSALWKIVMSLSFLRYIPEGFNENTPFVFTSLQNWLANLIGIWVAAAGFIASLPLLYSQFRAFKKPTEDEWQALLTPQDQRQNP